MVSEIKLNSLTIREKVQNRKRTHILQSCSISLRIDLKQKDTFHLMVIWMIHYSMDYWKTKLAFCDVFTVAFFLCILLKKVMQQFRVNASQPTLTYTHNVHADKKIVNVRSNLLQ